MARRQEVGDDLSEMRDARCALFCYFWVGIRDKITRAQQIPKSSLAPAIHGNRAPRKPPQHSLATPRMAHAVSTYSDAKVEGKVHVR